MLALPVACGGSAKTERHGADGLALSLETPGGWRAFSPEDVLKPDFVEALRKESPVLARIVQPMIRPNSPVKMLVVDPHVSQGFGSNVVVVTEPVGDLDLSGYADATIASIRRAGIALRPTRASVTLPAGEAVRLRYGIDIPGAGRRIRTSTDQYLLVRGGTGYVVTYTTLPGLRDRYAPVFDASARSIEFDDGGG